MFHYVADQHGQPIQTSTPRGYMLVFSFVRGDGVPSVVQPSHYIIILCSTSVEPITSLTTQQLVVVVQSTHTIQLTSMVPTTSSITRHTGVVVELS